MRRRESSRKHYANDRIYDNSIVRMILWMIPFKRNPRTLQFCRQFFRGNSILVQLMFSFFSFFDIRSHSRGHWHFVRIILQLKGMATHLKFVIKSNYEAVLCLSPDLDVFVETHLRWFIRPSMSMLEGLLWPFLWSIEVLSPAVISWVIRWFTATVIVNLDESHLKEPLLDDFLLFMTNLVLPEETQLYVFITYSLSVKSVCSVRCLANV